NTKTPNNTAGTGFAIWGNPDDENTTEVDEETPVGDYIKVDYIRILNDTGPDTNNDLVITGQNFGSGEGVSATSVPVSTGNFAQTGENLRLKIDADLDSGAFTSSFSTDSGLTWTSLVTDGAGLTEIANIMFGAKTGSDDAWGNTETSSTQGTAGDFVRVESITLTDVSDTNNPSELVNIGFEDENGTNIKNSLNSGTATGAWNFGGPQAHNGTLNIGHTQYFKWTNSGNLVSVFRKFVLDSALTSGQVSLVVDIKDYDLSRSWDNADSYNVNSGSGKGVQFALLNSTQTGPVINLFTESAVDFPDSDGDGIPDHVDDEPNSGDVFEGYYMRYDFSDDSGTALTDAVNLGVPPSAFTSGGPQTSNGNLNIGYTENWKWSGVDTGNAAVFRTNILPKNNEGNAQLTSGVVVYEMVIDSYDLSKSWDPNSESEAEKGIRMIIKNGDAGGNPNNPPTAPRQGTAIQLYTTGDGDVQVQAQPWYGTDGVVKSEDTVSYVLGESDMADDQGLTFQVVINLDTGAFYSRFSQDGGANWNDLIQYGSGFTTISSIQIASKRAGTDAWGSVSIEGGSTGDFVKIDSIHIRDADSLAEPTPQMPPDSDGDGAFDYEDAFPADPNESVDADEDGVGANSDPDDSDPNNPNSQAPAEAPALTITTDGSNVTVSWEGGDGFNLQSSGDLSTWSDTSVTTSPHTEALEGGKFFKLTNE
ncbi:MAG: hypothetical protein DBX03_01165, partial [Puniceicoccaceae bacterium]